MPSKERGAKWIATFAPDLLGWLRQKAKANDCPESVTLEYLGTRIWITPGMVTWAVDHVPKSREIAAEGARLAVKGASVQSIAATLGTTWETARRAVDLASIRRRRCG